MSNILLLKLEEDIKEKKRGFTLFLMLLLVTRVKVTFSVSSTSTAILTLVKDIKTRSGL